MAVVVESTAGDACIRVDQQCGDAIEEMIDDQVGGTPRRLARPRASAYCLTASTWMTGFTVSGMPMSIPGAAPGVKSDRIESRALMQVQRV